MRDRVATTQDVSRSFQLVAAPFTPMKADRSVDFNRVKPYYEFLRTKGIDGAFVCGTTGEGASLTGEERKRLLTAWAIARGEDASFRIFAHVGNESPALAADLAKHAQDCGSDAIAIHSPTFFKPRGEDSAVLHAAEIAAASPQLPFYYYHIPSMTGLSLSIPRLIELAKAHIPNFAGVKFTHGDLGEYLDCLNLAGDKLEIFFGRDELLFFGLGAGAAGAVGSTYNFAAPLYRQLIAAYLRGDEEEARRLQMESRRLISRIVCHGGLAGQKATMALVGFDCGPCRQPLDHINATQIQAIQEAIVSLPMEYL